VSWREELNAKRLKTRGWSGCDAPDGWKEIILAADQMLAHVDPDYQIHQVKEKYGTLRYYYATTAPGIANDIMRTIAKWAEMSSAYVCQRCGGPEAELTRTSLYETLCEECGPGSSWTDSLGQRLFRVHKSGDCLGEFCTIHKPSNHSMILFPQKWNFYLGYMERICPHGVNHPDPDEVRPVDVHGCDGCCDPNA
jgi:hypothetical protein